MRYLVRARVKPGREGDLLQAIEKETLGQGSVAEGEYLRNMNHAQLAPDHSARWVEVCYCPTPLQEEQTAKATCKAVSSAQKLWRPKRSPPSVIALG